MVISVIQDAGCEVKKLPDLSNRTHATWPPSLTASTDAFISTPFLIDYSSLQPPSGRALPVGFVGLKNLANQVGI